MIPTSLTGRPTLLKPLPRDLAKPWEWQILTVIAFEALSSGPHRWFKIRRGSRVVVGTLLAQLGPAEDAGDVVELAADRDAVVVDV
jgi:hypothetical protein